MFRIIAVLLLLAGALSLAHDVARSVTLQTALISTPLNHRQSQVFHLAPQTMQNSALHLQVI